MPSSGNRKIENKEACIHATSIIGILKALPEDIIHPRRDVVRGEQGKSAIDFDLSVALVKGFHSRACFDFLGFLPMICL
jgi:hypothetical protein